MSRAPWRMRDLLPRGSAKDDSSDSYCNGLNCLFSRLIMAIAADSSARKNPATKLDIWEYIWSGEPGDFIRRAHCFSGSYCTRLLVAR
jgi:hypothetical protein